MEKKRALERQFVKNASAEVLQALITKINEDNEYFNGTLDDIDRKETKTHTKELMICTNRARKRASMSAFDLKARNSATLKLERAKSKQI